MKYVDTGITLLEVPDEISLYFTISGCPLRCPGCHSPFLRNAKYGSDLTVKVLEENLAKVNGYATCVLFMGGEWDPETLKELLYYVRNQGLTTALYSGEDSVSEDLLELLTYVKTGAWVEGLGGLASELTNQRLIRVSDGELLNYKFH